MITPVVPVVPAKGAKAVVAGAAKDKPAHAVVTKDDQLAQSSPNTVLHPASKFESTTEGLPTDKVDSLQPETGVKASDTAAASKERKFEKGSAMEAKSIKKDSKPIEKPHPGNLDMEAIKSQGDGNIDPLDESHASASVKDVMLTNTTTTPVASQPQTPMTAVSQASTANAGKGGQPRTIRVVQTSKSEIASKGAIASIAKEATSTTSAIPSRRGSLSSINPPGTPASERISDNASLASASISRADSPPPGKVGTAPIRHVSKSQQKKERQKAKQAEEVVKNEEIPAKAPAEEPVQAPITSRKKKQKKPSTTTKKGTRNSTPAVTRPSSPLPHDEGSQAKDESLPVTPGKDGKKSESKVTVASEVDNPNSPPGTSTPEQPHKSTLSAAALFAQLQRSGQIPANAIDIFKPVMGLNHRFDVDPQSFDLQMPEASIGLPPPLTEAQNKQIDLGEPVCIEQPNNKRIVVLPDRRTLRGLIPDQASRYLSLRTKAIDTVKTLHSAGHGPAPPRPVSQPEVYSSTNPAARNGGLGTTEDLPNPFLTDEERQPSVSVQHTASSRLPLAFGSTYSASPTTYVDEAAAFIATRREQQQQSASHPMSVEEAAAQWEASKKEVEGLEKKLNAVVKRNRRMVMG